MITRELTTAELLELNTGLQALAEAKPQTMELVVLIADAIVGAVHALASFRVQRETLMREQPAFATDAAAEPTPAQLAGMRAWNQRMNELLGRRVSVELPEPLSRDVLAEFKEVPDPRAIAACGCLFGLARGSADAPPPVTLSAERARVKSARAGRTAG